MRKKSGQSKIIYSKIKVKTFLKDGVIEEVKESLNSERAKLLKWNLKINDLQLSQRQVILLIKRILHKKQGAKINESTYDNQ